MYHTLLKLGDHFDLQDWKKSDLYTQKVFFWIPDYATKLGKTYCLLNLSWPQDGLVNTIPRGYDTYIISFHLEYPDYEWIKKFKKYIGESRLILINQFDSLPLDLEGQVNLITYDVWPIVIESYLQEYGFVDLSTTKRSKKISALANRVCQARTYICAYIHQTWNQSDYIMSWRKAIIENKDLYLLDYTGNNRIDRVIDYIKSTFFDLEIIPPDQQNFKNNPRDNLFYNWTAYNECAINFTNESVNCSHIYHDGKDSILPGPYLTEKTIKCLLSSTTLIPVGQFGSYNYLEKMGFRFDYPWDRSFDTEERDIVRFSLLLDVIDQINQFNLDEIVRQTSDSNHHNLEHIISGKYKKKILDRLTDNINKGVR